MKKKLLVMALPHALFTSLDAPLGKYENRWFNRDKVGALPHHLYLLSPDEDIKEGDWFIDRGVLDNKMRPTLAEALPSSDLTFLNHPTKRPYIQKAVATTNPDLLHPGGYNEGQLDDHPALPRIPQSLVDAFVQSQGTLKEVWVHDHPNFDMLHIQNGEVIWSLVEEEDPNVEYFLQFLNERIEKASSVQSEVAYKIVREQFTKMFKT